MGHIITMCIRDIDSAPVFKFIGEIHMPLFFFISGWFSLRMVDGHILSPRIKSRAARLLVPMIVVSTLWIIYYPHSGLQSPLDSTFAGLWFNIWKNGYWFTLCLFEIILIYAAVVPTLNRSRSPGGDIAICAAAWAILFASYSVFGHTDAGQLLGLELLATFWPAFTAGVLAAKHRKKFDEALVNPYCSGLLFIIGAFILYYISWWWEFPGKELFEVDQYNLVIARPIFHICLAFIAIALFKPIIIRQTANLSDSNRAPLWIRIWSYVGVNSLGIYLLHYFFLFPMSKLREPMEALGLSFTPMLAISATAAAAVVAVTLGAIRLVAINPWLSFLLTGSKFKV